MEANQARNAPHQRHLQRIEIQNQALTAIEAEALDEEEWIVKEAVPSHLGVMLVGHHDLPDPLILDGLCRAHVQDL